jgi:hypothetical protein
LWVSAWYIGTCIFKWCDLRLLFVSRSSR